MLDLFDTALRMPPPAPEAVNREARQPIGQLDPLTPAVMTSLGAPTPSSPAVDATTSAQAAVDQLLGGPTFNTGRSVIAFLIFVALVGGGIATEATHLTTASYNG